MGFTVGIVAILGIAAYCLWRRFVVKQKRKETMQRNLAMSSMSRMPCLDRSIAERMWAKPASAPRLEHKAAAIEAPEPVYPKYTIVDMLNDLAH